MKNLVLTGASSGIGYELSKKYAEEGYNLFLISRNLEKLRELKKYGEELGVEVQYYLVDISNFDKLKEVVLDILDKVTSIDLVIANAGVHFKEQDKDKTLEFTNFKKTIDVNFVSIHCLFEPIIERMKMQSFGKLVVISSLASFVGMPTGLAYNASKRALNSYAESLRNSLASYNIEVINIQPGFINTPLTQSNNYKKPFMLSLKDGTNRIFKAIENGKPEYAFPLFFAFFVKSISILPRYFRDSIIKFAYKRQYKSE